MKQPNALLYVIVIVAAIITRIIPHMWNLAPVSAIAIVAAVYLPKKQAVVLPLAIRLVSDFIIGFFAWQQMLVVYLCHLLGVGLGLWIRKNKNLPRIVIAPTISAIVFFLATNFAFLYRVDEYPHDWNGIVLSYTNGLPFLRGTLLGDVGYTLVLIGSVEFIAWYRQKSPVRSFQAPRI